MDTKIHQNVLIPRASAKLCHFQGFLLYCYNKWSVRAFVTSMKAAERGNILLISKYGQYIMPMFLIDAIKGFGFYNKNVFCSWGCMLHSCSIRVRCASSLIIFQFGFNVSVWSSGHGDAVLIVLICGWLCTQLFMVLLSSATHFPMWYVDS